MAEGSLLSDELLRHLMAVGQVDVVVGVPTLNNASTIGGVVSAVHQAFGRYFSRDRTVLINSDGGSVDGTQDVIRDCSVDQSGTVTVSHALRTMHSISTPYHGVPGKGSALRQIMTAADLAQAKVVAVLDADVASATPEWVASLVQPVRNQQFDYVAPIYSRHPLDSPLITQLVRPLFRAASGWQVREPLAAEFGCSNRFLTHCLEQAVWDDELARYGIDLWLTATALYGGFRCCQTTLGPRVAAAAHGRPGFQEVFQQVAGSVFLLLEQQASFWLTRVGSEQIPIAGPAADGGSDGQAPGVSRLASTLRDDLRNLESVLQAILSEDTLRELNAIAEANLEELHYPDALWVRTVYEFLGAFHRGVMKREHVTQALIPLYLGRTGSFLIEQASRSQAEVEAALEALCVEFERAKPSLVEHWNQNQPHAR
jgi:hypothetical protein